jgi:hypothetical protein
MIFKFFEVRDEFTRIPVMAVKFEPNRCQVCTTERDRDIENIFLYHGGFGDDNDFIIYLNCVKFPYVSIFIS